MISEKGFVLENGTELPFLGFGTWLVKEEKIILDALASGYRHIDTARRYENEKMVGNALRQKRQNARQGSGRRSCRLCLGFCCLMRRRKA